VIYLVDFPFRNPHFTHHSANISAFLDSTFYFPHSTIPHFTNNRKIIPVKITDLSRAVKFSGKADKNCTVKNSAMYTFLKIGQIIQMNSFQSLLHWICCFSITDKQTISNTILKVVPTYESRTCKLSNVASALAADPRLHAWFRC